jgi:hypothetical protein
MVVRFPEATQPAVFPTNGLEGAMTKQQPAPAVQSAKAVHEDLTRILGDLDDAEIVEILTLHPTVSEVEQAALWAAGEGEILATQGHTLSGVVAEIVDIVTADEEDEEGPRPINP